MTSLPKYRCPQNRISFEYSYVIYDTLDAIYNTINIAFIYLLELCLFTNEL